VTIDNTCVDNELPTSTWYFSEAISEQNFGKENNKEMKQISFTIGVNLLVTVDFSCVDPCLQQRYSANIPSEVSQIHIRMSQKFQNHTHEKVLTTPDLHLYPMEPDIFDVKATYFQFMFLSTDVCIVPK
jgi:hypothetical protein